MPLTLSRSADSLARETADRAEAACAAVNAAIDGVRRSFITPIAGQSMIYLEKEAEALAYVAADPEPATLEGWEAGYPFSASEVGATAPTPYEVAQVYLNLAAQWRAAGAQLENLRIGTITAVNAAATVWEIEAAMTDFTAAVEAFA